MIRGQIYVGGKKLIERDSRLNGRTSLSWHKVTAFNGDDAVGCRENPNELDD